MIMNLSICHIKLLVRLWHRASKLNALSGGVGSASRSVKLGNRIISSSPSLALSRNRRSNNGNSHRISSVIYSARTWGRNYSFLVLQSFLLLIQHIVFNLIIFSGKHIRVLLGYSL